jgi:nitric oxide reductase subunit C
MYTADPAFWRAGAISSTAVMLIVLAFLTVDSLATIRPGGANVPPYTVVDKEIRYEYDSDAGRDRPVIGADQPLFGRTHSTEEAEALVRKGKLTIQSRNCLNCHTFFGNGAYYAPDLTKAWLDPAWQQMWMPMTQSDSREKAMVAFLMEPEKYATWSRQMPNLKITREEAEALVAYMKWMSAVETNGFPIHFGHIQTSN